MSAVFEGILLPRRTDDDWCPELKRLHESQGDGIRIGLAALDRVVLAIVRVDDRSAPFSEKFDELGAALSSTFGKALVVRYDSRIGHRSSTLYAGGFESAAFAEDNVTFSLLDENGWVAGDRVSSEELDGEYEIIENAIELGLERLGAGVWEDLIFLIYNQEDLVDADRWEKPGTGGA